MIRKARKTDFPFVYPILKQIFDEMQMASIAALPESQFYDLMQLGFISEDYRYSYRRIWVETNDHDEVQGILDMYSYHDQKVIDFVLRHEYAKVGLPISTIIFDDQEAWPHEWYLDALAVHPDHWGEGIASQLLDYAPQIAKQNGYDRLSLNVDKENPRAQRLYWYKGFETTKTMTIGDRIYDHMIKKI
ncbi:MULTISPECIES: GNAT family N-acetyltransferase [Lactobacillus]|uniref:N-acetyltransferase n=1 Tax=Lactobacillus xujianguonis TaxID=2495899 RepID=A0A437SSD6_9LACO|nr:MULTISPECIES: GNAT family N-acetyltransferase [Lactobacillus]RVU69845.1 N-acetyltransferase [Lactobacillus xujianguonis]RVU71924.1 N-acetyltransferase [Lactobacillus xujianguonis]